MQTCAAEKEGHREIGLFTVEGHAECAHHQDSPYASTNYTKQLWLLLCIHLKSQCLVKPIKMDTFPSVKNGQECTGGRPGYVSDDIAPGLGLSIGQTFSNFTLRLNK